MSKLTKILILVSGVFIVFIIIALTRFGPLSNSSEEIDTNTIFKEADSDSLTFTDSFGEFTYKLNGIVNIYCIDEFKTDDLVSLDDASLLSETTSNNVKDAFESGEQISFMLSGDIEDTESYTIMAIFKKCRIAN